MFLKLMKKYFIITFAISILFSHALVCYANGGPVDSNALVEASNIVFKNVKDIILDKEIIDISIDKDYIDVKVDYTLINKGEATQLDYVFPILIFYEEHGLNNAFIDSISMLDNGNNLDYLVMDIYKPQYFDYSKKMKHSEFTELITDTPKVFRANTDIGYGEIKYKNIHTTLKFDKNEEKKLTISYRTKSMYTDWGISNSFTPSFDIYSLFGYNLSPAANWGNGKIREFQLNLQYKELLDVGGDIVMSNIPKFEKNGTGKFTYKKWNMNLKDYPQINIMYDNSDYRQKKYLDDLKLLNDKYIDKIISSSTLAKTKKYTYEASNMIDGNYNTCWAEGLKDSGKGETIDIYLKKKCNLTGVGLINGYLSNEKTYAENNRIKKVKIEILDSKGIIIESYIKHLPDVPFKEINLKNPYDNIDIIYNQGDSGRELESYYRIRLTILEVYQGSKYDDTCISEIILFGSEI